jgi:hypothetical protein
MERALLEKRLRTLLRSSQFSLRTQFKGRTLHMASELHGVRVVLFLTRIKLMRKLKGRYIPAFAAEIYDQNAMLTAAGITLINLQSIMIGNCMYQKLCITSLSLVQAMV